jgi:4-amino-4-deoxy-L-arabinose transferase-like glycosyltransferase
MSPAQRFLIVLLLIYTAKQLFNVVVFPPFSGHDEVAHFAYIETVATEHRVPRFVDLSDWPPPGANAPPLPPGDYLPDRLYKYCDYVIGWQGPNVCETDQPSYLAAPKHVVFYNMGIGYKVVGFQYAANHPPLYYMLMTPLYWLTDGASPETQLYFFRAAAIPFGLITIFLAYLLARLLFRDDSFLAITVPAFVAFQPQVSYEAAMVNNDIVAIAAYSALLSLLVWGIRERFPPKILVLTGFTFGIALLAKGTGLTAAPLIALAVVVSSGLRNVRDWLRKGAFVLAISGLLVWPWYLFLYRTYGNLSAFDQISALQWNNYRVGGTPSFWELFWNKNFATLRWQETWGMFGWRRLPLDGGLLWAIAIPLILGLTGLVGYGVIVARNARNDVQGDAILQPQRWQIVSLALMLSTCIVAYLAIIQFGLRFELTQARYYFPAVNAVAVLLMLGLRTLTPIRWRTFGQGAIVAGLILMNVVIYSQYVIPYRLEGWL